MEAAGLKRHHEPNPDEPSARRCDDNKCAYIHSVLRWQRDDTSAMVAVGSRRNVRNGWELHVVGQAWAGEVRLFQTFFDFLPGWLSGFGAQANVTYIDHEQSFAADPEAEDDVTVAEIPGLSKWTYNLVGMYEQGGFRRGLPITTGAAGSASTMPPPRVC